jgi:Ca2+-binding EF-hand superfamily protein
LLDESELESIIADVDKNSDGMIDYKEFLEMMKNNENLKEILT